MNGLKKHLLGLDIDVIQLKGELESYLKHFIMFKDPRRLRLYYKTYEFAYFPIAEYFEMLKGIKTKTLNIPPSKEIWKVIRNDLENLSQTSSHLVESFNEAMKMWLDVHRRRVEATRYIISLAIATLALIVSILSKA